MYKWELDKGNQSLEIAVNGSLILDELDLVTQVAIDGCCLWVSPRGPLLSSRLGFYQQPINGPVLVRR